jgi:alkylation response protein AidB-like acyl-CoA dehydrogenase
LREVLPEIEARADRCDALGLFPSDDVHLLGKMGLLQAFAPGSADRDGFSSHERHVSNLFDCLRLLGRANLSLGRIFEGHVNATLLIARYGDDRIRERMAEAVSRGKLFGVWNTEAAPGTSLENVDGRWVVTGAKTYATGAGHLDFAVITARLPGGGKQMLVMPVGEQRDRADPGAWRVSGMRATVSGAHDFSGVTVGAEDFLGGPGDYEREPMFTAGAWRFTAVQLGGIEALVQHLRNHLQASGGAEDPIHRARFARTVAMARTAYLWVREAAMRTELASTGDARPFVLMTRGVVEDAALGVIESVQRGVGTRAFFTGGPIDRIMRDLQLYLRQPVPDQARDRAAEAWLEIDRWDGDRWW